MTKAWSDLGRTIWFRNSIADSCSKLEAIADGVAGVDQQPHAERQVGLAAEAQQCRLAGLLSSSTWKSPAVEVLDESAVPVGDGEDDVHFVHGLDDGGDRALGLASPTG